MELGGYLSHRLYPQHRVFIDSRQLSLPLVKRYIGIMTSWQEWQKAEAEHGFRVVVLSNLATVSPLALRTFLLEDPRWRMIYLDPQAVIFARDQTSGLVPRIDPAVPSSRDLVVHDKAPFLTPKPSWLRKLALRALLLYEPYSLLAHYLAVLGDLRQYDALEELATRALEVYPDDAAILRVRGAARLVTGSFPAAARDFERLVQFRPNDLEARVLYASALYSQRRSREALEQLNHVLKIDPAHLSAAELHARITRQEP
jgi:tetratricopeptide (TPR) repeat protein